MLREVNKYTYRSKQFSLHFANQIQLEYHIFSKRKLFGLLQINCDEKEPLHKKSPARQVSKESK